MTDPDTLEFVVFDQHGAEVDWLDPYVFHQPVPDPDDDRLIVETSFCEYLVAVPEGGRYEVRPLENP